MKKISIISLMVCVLLSSCSSGKSEIKNSAKEWFAAVANRDMLTADDLVCSESKEEFRQMSANGAIFYLVVDQFLEDVEIEFDDSKMNYDVTDVSKNNATINVSGEFRASVAGMVQAQEIDETWNMEKEDGEWKWCGYVGGHSNVGYMGNASSQQEGNDDALASPDVNYENGEGYSYFIWNLEESETQDEPGWTAYEAKVAFAVPHPYSTLMFRVENCGGNVVTTDGNVYPARIETGRDGAWNCMTAINNFYSSSSVVSTGYFIDGIGGSSLSPNSSFRLTYKIPSTMTASKLVLTENNREYDLITISQLPHYSVEDGEKTAISQFNTVNENSLPLATDDFYEGGRYGFKFSNPRIIEGEYNYNLVIDVEFTSLVSTNDIEVNMGFNAVDSYGVLYTEESSICGDSENFNQQYFEDTFTIGPLQKVNGTYCVYASKKFANQDAFEVGDFVFSGNIDGSPLAFWFHGEIE